MSDTKTPEAAAIPRSQQRVVRRQWCVDRACAIARPETEVRDILEMAVQFEEYLETGKQSQKLEVALLASTMDEAENCVMGVTKHAARKLRDFLIERGCLPPNSDSATASRISK